MTTILVDADSLIYQSGFVTQKKREDGTIAVEPKENAFYLLNSALRGIQQVVIDTRIDIDGFYVYLTGKGNFREELATIRPYKGNREKTAKPVWYNEMREYLVNRWQAKIVEGREADDEVSIEARRLGEKCIICSIDKDLLQIPGHHYNFKKKEFSEVSELEAARNFWTQVITGDATDNIPGVYKAGKKAAQVALLPLKSRKATTFAKAAYKVSLGLYQDSIDKFGEATGYAEMGAKEALLENARLLHLLRHEGDVWQVP